MVLDGGESDCRGCHSEERRSRDEESRLPHADDEILRFAQNDNVAGGRAL
jgi:hypothetical protein